VVCNRCSRELSAFIFSIILAVFLLCSVAGPWYLIVITGVPPTPPQIQTRTLRYLFWWRGVLFSEEDQQGNVKAQDWIEWSDMPSSQPQATYMVSVMMALAAFLTTILLSAFLVFGFLVQRTRLKTYYCLKGKAKWVAVVISALVIVLTITSFSVFTMLPSSLRDAAFCPVYILPFAVTSNSAGLWCSDFYGEKSIDIQMPPSSSSSSFSPEPLLAPNEGTADADWLPFVSWVSCVVSLLWAVITFGLVCSIKSYQPDESEYQYIQ